MTQNCVCFQTLSVSPGNCSAVGGKMPNTETAVACPPIHDFKQNRVLHQWKLTWILCSLSVREVSQTRVSQKALNCCITLIRKASEGNNTHNVLHATLIHQSIPYFLGAGG